MRVEYREPLAAWIFLFFLSEVRTGYMRYMGWMDVLGRGFVYFSKTYRARWEKQSHGHKRTANSTGRLHNDHHRAACTPHSTLHRQ